MTVIKYKPLTLIPRKKYPWIFHIFQKQNKKYAVIKVTGLHFGLLKKIIMSNFPEHKILMIQFYYGSFRSVVSTIYLRAILLIKWHRARFKYLELIQNGRAGIMEPKLPVEKWHHISTSRISIPKYARTHTHTLSLSLSLSLSDLFLLAWRSSGQRLHSHTASSWPLLSALKRYGTNGSSRIK